MCAIVGSSDKKILKELFKLNAYRGQLSYSLSGVSDNRVINLIRGEGALPADLVDTFPEYSYYIGHIQAPTTESKSIHPAMADSNLLWHNGIVKQKELEDGTWDTEWLIQNLTHRGFEFLSDVDGTFACMASLNHKLYVFRNEISPLYIDDAFNISSTRFDGSHSLEPNTIFELDINKKLLSAVTHFETKENPYFFG